MDGIKTETIIKLEALTLSKKIFTQIPIVSTVARAGTLTTNIQILGWVHDEGDWVLFIRDSLTRRIRFPDYIVENVPREEQYGGKAWEAIQTEQPQIFLK